MNKIFLEKNRNKESVNTSNGLVFQMSSYRKTLPQREFDKTVNAYEQYLAERADSTKIRLTLQIGTVCSNILFNHITEVVKDEGSDDCQCVNFWTTGDTAHTVDGSVLYKSNKRSAWAGNNTVVRDTQLSRIGYVYHCGLNIFNNHLLRSNSFKMVCPMVNVTQENAVDFNTIRDNMRDVEGTQVQETITYPVSAGISSGPKNLHLYNADDLDTFQECIEGKLIKTHDGWVGFNNPTKMKTFSNFKNSVDMQIDKTICYKNGGDFIDMYPSRDLYSFVPKYNGYRKRIEKNWNYCLTYPCSSDTEDFTDIIETNDGLNSLKALYFDERIYDDAGAPQTAIYGIAKHGLKKGDRVNVYKTYLAYTEGETKVYANEAVLSNVEVTNVVGDYIFTVNPNGVRISDDWVSLGATAMPMIRYPESSIIWYDIDSSGKYYTKRGDTAVYPHKYYIVNSRGVNFGEDSQSISFKKVVNGVECDYYVRIFSRLPNFKFASASTETEYDLYAYSGAVITQNAMVDFENHLTRLSFARNIYSDDIAQVVYTDDVDLKKLKDNRGRPLTSLFFTVVKNNAGYKEWYGTGHTVGSSDVEFSHCFGPVTCAFDLSDESYAENVSSIRRIDNVADNGGGNSQSGDDNIHNNGVDVSMINDRGAGDVTTHVLFEKDRYYYGDLVCHNPYEATEESIQYMMHRFNTAQRESNMAGVELDSNTFSQFEYDKLSHDDYDSDSHAFEVGKVDSTQCNQLREGYFYQPHYEIKIRTFGALNTVMPDFLTVRKKETSNDGICRFVTLERHYLDGGDKVIIYDDVVNKAYTGVVVTNKQSTDKIFYCEIYNSTGRQLSKDDIDAITEYRLFKIDNLGIPSYAELMTDGTCRYVWRDIYQNGLATGVDEEEEYPFTNGAIYVNKQFNIYVKRQDPESKYGLYDPTDLLGTFNDIETEDNYVKEEDIEC